MGNIKNFPTFIIMSSEPTHVVAKLIFWAPTKKAGGCWNSLTLTWRRIGGAWRLLEPIDFDCIFYSIEKSLPLLKYFYYRLLKFVLLNLPTWCENKFLGTRKKTWKPLETIDFDLEIAWKLLETAGNRWKLLTLTVYFILLKNCYLC